MGKIVLGSDNLNWPDIRTPSLIALFATPNTALTTSTPSILVATTVTHS